MIGAVALLSGGLDSCVAVAEAVAAAATECRPAVAALHAGYGQRTAARERAAFCAIADHYRLRTRLEIDLTFLGHMGGSSLTDAELSVPGAQAPENGVPSTYVPFRNANLLAAAVAWAETLGATQVYCGAHAPGSVYPDTQAPFFAAFEEVVRLGTPKATRIRLRTPLLGLDKAAIVRRGLTLDAPLHLTWSCYQSQDLPCGDCHSCHLRARGFAEAGVPDPLLRSTPCSPDM